MAAGDQQRRGGHGGMAQPVVAWLSTLVFEALDMVASPAARIELIKTALETAGLDTMPSDPDDLMAFALGPLAEAVSGRLGDGAGEALVQGLEPVLQHALAAAPPSPEPSPEPPPEPAAARGAAAAAVDLSGSAAKRSTLRMARPRELVERSAAQPVRVIMAPASASASQGKRTTFPYLHAVLQQAEARLAVLIDDERAFLGGYAGVFRQRGFLVFTAPNAAEALALCTRLKPEFVLADLGMPELDAQDFTAQLVAGLGDSAPLVALLCDPEDAAQLKTSVARCFAKGTAAKTLVEELAGKTSAPAQED